MSAGLGLLNRSRGWRIIGRGDKENLCVLFVRAEIMG